MLAHLPALRFADQTPTEVFATLLNEGVYLCLIRSTYRILAAQGEFVERCHQPRHPVFQKPELLAEAPKQNQRRRNQPSAEKPLAGNQELAQTEKAVQKTAFLPCGK